MTITFADPPGYFAFTPAFADANLFYNIADAASLPTSCKLQVQYAGYYYYDSFCDDNNSMDAKYQDDSTSTGFDDPAPEVYQFDYTNVGDFL